jgi:hypothetical protein
MLSIMKTLLLVISSFLCASCFAQDMQQYLKDTRQMVQEKKYPEALERMIWFHDHALEHEPAMVGVRLSFALSDWKRLGSIYPPALTALKEMRDNKTKAILDSNASPKFLADVVALNRTLNENNKSIALFETIEKMDNSKAKSCWLWINEVMFDAKRYDIVKKYISNPVNEFSQVKSLFDLTNSVEKNDSINGRRIQALRSNRFVQRILQLIDYSIAITDLKSAKEIQEKALAVVDDKRLREVKIE